VPLLDKIKRRDKAGGAGAQASASNGGAMGATEVLRQPPDPESTGTADGAHPGQADTTPPPADGAAPPADGAPPQPADTEHREPADTAPFEPVDSAHPQPTDMARPMPAETAPSEPADTARPMPAETAPSEPAADARPELAGTAPPERSHLDPRRLAARAAHGVWACMVPIAAGLAAAIPVINSTIKAVHAGWAPAGDDGIIATRGWDVLSSHTPLVGQYSEAGLVIHGQIMHSPGPMLYWLIALPARLGSITSIAVTMCIANTLAIIGCVALARRRGGLVLMFASAIGIALMCQSLPTEGMHDIWNPAAGLFPFLLLIFLGWSLACGDQRLLPLTALVASFVVQTHLMYAAPTAVVLTVGLGGLLIRWLARRLRPAGAEPRQRPSRVWPWALAALVVAAACWTAPAIDQIEHRPGNLATIVRSAEHRGPALGSSIGWNALVRSVGVRPWWLYVPASEWDRKYDVLRTPGNGASGSTIALLIALAVAGLIGAFRRRWDLTAAALIGLGMSGAIAVQAAANPAAKLLAETLGYTMWWGSELGFWVWLILAWALWLGLVGLSRMALDALRRRAGAHGRALPSWARPTAVGLASLASLAGAVAVGNAVAATAKPDSHVYDYQPIRKIAAGIEGLIPPGRVVVYGIGPLDTGTQPIEPALRFFLVRHGDRVLARGSFPRLGSYYELYNRPVQWRVYLTDGTRPQPHMVRAARVHFVSPWGREVLSAWVGRVAAPRAKTARASRSGR